MTTRWKIVVAEGPFAGQHFEVPRDRPLVIGRGSQSDTKLNLPQLSRVHCRVAVYGNQLQLIDENSSGGTFLRGTRIEAPALLGSGDEFLVGPVRMRVEADNPLDAATDVERPAPSNLASTPIDHLVGNDLHEFHLERIVAYGATGVIFAAQDTKHETQVAVKILMPHLAADDAQRERFVRAMRTVLPIKHPHIVRMVNAGRRGPYCWAAMEWIDGVSAEQLIERIGTGGALDWEDVWRVGMHISRALEEAERLHMIHRNITPSNILRRDEDKAFLLNDLFLAKALDETNHAQLTRPGDVLGELLYMAPERLLRSDAVDHRIDQYSLGCTLYALLVGKPPFMATSVPDLLKAFRAPATPPRFRRPRVHEPFEDIVLRMVAVEPEKRFPHAAAVTRELKEVGRRRGLEVDWGTW